MLITFISFQISCVLSILASVTDIPALDNAAAIVDAISEFVFRCLAGCMVGQVHHELNYQRSKGPQAQMSLPVPVHAQPVGSAGDFSIEKQSESNNYPAIAPPPEQPVYGKIVD